MCDLYALSVIEENGSGTWSTTDRRHPSKAIRAKVDALSAELRGRALELVGGLGVPVGWLNSAMETDASEEKEELAG